jgi:hypothetical protein
VLGEQSSERPVVGVGPGVVGHDPLRLYAQGGKPVQRPPDERGHGVGALIGVQLAVGQAGVVIDDGVGMLMPTPRLFLGEGLVADSGDGVARSQESGVALGVHMQEVARARPLVPAGRVARRPRSSRKAMPPRQPAWAIGRATKTVGSRPQGGWRVQDSNLRFRLEGPAS